MSLDIETEKQRLAQGDFLKWTGRQISPAEMVTVYLDDKADDHNIGMYCALIPNDQIERSLADPSWDLQLGHGLPQAMKWHDEERWKSHTTDMGVMNTSNHWSFAETFME